MALEIGSELPRHGEKGQRKFLDVLIMSLGAFKHFAYKIHELLYLACILDKYWTHRLVHN